MTFCPYWHWYRDAAVSCSSVLQLDRFTQIFVVSEDDGVAVVDEMGLIHAKFTHHASEYERRQNYPVWSCGGMHHASRISAARITAWTWTAMTVPVP